VAAAAMLHAEQRGITNDAAEANPLPVPVLQDVDLGYMPPGMAGHKALQ
jgi:hypothetical protein